MRMRRILGVGRARQPPLRAKKQRILAPRLPARIHRPRRQDDRRALGYERPREGGVARGDAHGERDGRVEAQDLGAEGLEVGAAVDVCGLEVFSMVLLLVVVP